MAIQTKIAKPRRAKTKATQPLTPAADHGRTMPKGKLGEVISLLSRPEGTRIDDLMAATGWQAHSVRGAISGALKKNLGLVISSDKTDAGRVYRIVKDEPAGEA